MDSVKVRDVKVFSVKVPRTSTWSLQRGRIPTHSTFTIVKIVTEDGVVGWGEAAFPLASIRHLVTDYMVDIVKENNPLDIERIHQKIDQVEMMVMERVGCWNPARAAIDIALHDIKGKYFNVAAWRLLGSLCREEIPMIKSVGVGDVEQTLKAAEEIVAEGYNVVKVRVGEDSSLDIARIEALYNRFGSNLKMRADVNQGWQTKQSILIIREMEKYEIEAVEQPLKRGDIWGARKVVSQVKTPIIADEGFWTIDEAMLLLRESAADVLHLYLSKCGGLYPGWKIAKLAESFNADVTLGERVPLGMCEAADAHFAAALPKLDYACDISYDLNEHDLLTQSLSRSRGKLRVPEGPGLGISVDEEKLAFYEQK